MLLENYMELNPLEQFSKEVRERAIQYRNDSQLQSALRAFQDQIVINKYGYNFFWLGIPILQTPQDLQALQEIIWETKPDLIIETGIAFGGSLVFSASMLAILEACHVIDKGEVIGIDIDIRPHNKAAILAHPLSSKITMIEGSSIDKDIIAQVAERARNKRVLVCLDSNHTHEHVLAELRGYAPLVSLGGYCMVGDTGVEDLSEEALFDRPWKKGNSPKSAVWEFIEENKDFVIDKIMDSKLILTGSPDGYLKRIG